MSRFGDLDEGYSVVELAALLADAVSPDVDEIRTIDVLDWLASSGLTLRPDSDEASVAYQLLLEEAASADENNLDGP